MLADPCLPCVRSRRAEYLPNVPQGAIAWTVYGRELLTGDPEAWGNLLPQLPFMMMGAGEHGLPFYLSKPHARQVMPTALAAAATKGGVKGALKGTVSACS